MTSGECQDRLRPARRLVLIRSSKLNKSFPLAVSKEGGGVEERWGLEVLVCQSELDLSSSIMAGIFSSIGSGELEGVDSEDTKVR